jgi:iron complex transport system substrate-binding protein
MSTYPSRIVCLTEETTETLTSVITSRAGWSEVQAVRDGHIYEIPLTYILQPGPAALTEGVRQIHARLALVANGAHSTATFDGIKRLS